MNKNLGWKLVLIIATLLVFLYGIFGIPKGVSGSALAESLQDRIHLGLDLKGGTHLILQVQVNDAVKVEADNALQRMKEAMRTQKINYADITQPDPVGIPIRSSSKASAGSRAATCGTSSTSGCRNTICPPAPRTPGRFR